MKANKLILSKYFDESDIIFFEDNNLSIGKEYECQGQFLQYNNKSYCLNLYYLKRDDKIMLLPKDIIDKYFITQQEYRKQKLQKINKLKWEETKF